MNSKISCISTLFQKEISILGHIAKWLQARQYLQNCLEMCKKKHDFVVKKLSIFKARSSKLKCQINYKKVLGI